MPNYKVDSEDPLPRYYQVYASLLERIQAGEFGPGDTLPSERQLTNDYSVSRITVIKALDMLVRDNLIERQHGRGTFVLDQAETANCEADFTVTFCLPAFADSYLISVLSGATRVAMQNGIQLQFVGTEKNTDEAKFIRHAIENGTNGIIVFPRYPYANEALYRELVNKRYPLIMIDRYYPNAPVDYVVFDDEAAGYTLTEMLIKQGHTRIAVFTGHEVAVTSVRNRLRGYQRAIEAYGIPYDEDLVDLDVYEDLSPDCLDNLQSTYVKLFEKIKIYAPTALIAINNPVAEQMNIDLMKIKAERMQAVIEGQVEEGIQTMDLAVAAISHKYITYDQSTLVALAIHSGEALGVKAMELLIGRLNQTITGNPLAINIPMETALVNQINFQETFKLF